MAGSQEREARVRFLETSQEQGAAVEAMFPAEVAEGRRCVGVMAVFLPKGTGPAEQEQARRRLREDCQRVENLGEIRAQIERLQRQEAVLARIE